VAALYGVETREVNQAVRNNPRKFLEGYVLELTKEESVALRSKISTIETLRSNNSTLEGLSGKGRYDATVAIVETFDKVQGLKREFVALHPDSLMGRGY